MMTDRHSSITFEITVPASVVDSLAQRGELAGYRIEWLAEPMPQWVTADIRVDSSEMALFVTRPELGESVFSEYRHPSHGPDAWVPRPREISFDGFSVTPDGARELLAAAQQLGAEGEAWAALAKALGMIPS